LFFKKSEEIYDPKNPPPILLATTNPGLTEVSQTICLVDPGALYLSTATQVEKNGASNFK